MEITKLTDDQIQTFKDAAAPIYESYKDQIGEDLFAKFGYNK